MLRWKTSSRSQGNGACVEVAWSVSSHTANNGNCVEVGWTTSSHSQGNGNCVEVAHTPSRIHIRDTKDRSGPVLTISPTTWHGFMRSLREG